MIIAETTYRYTDGVDEVQVTADEHRVLNAVVDLIQNTQPIGEAPLARFVRMCTIACPRDCRTIARAIINETLDGMRDTERTYIVFENEDDGYFD
jgi:hypothetical protein